MNALHIQVLHLHLILLLLLLFLGSVLIILHGCRKKRYAATVALSEPENHLEHSQAKHDAVLALVSHAIVVPLVVTLVLHCRHVVTTLAAHRIGSASDHHANPSYVTATEAAIAPSADESRPEPEGTNRHQDKVEAHDDSPRSHVAPDVSPASSIFPAVYLIFAEHVLILLNSQNIRIFIGCGDYIEVPLKVFICSGAFFVQSNCIK